jgi:hypothetical protein
LRGAVAAGTATALLGTALVTGGPAPASAAKNKGVAKPAAFCPNPGTDYRAPLDALQAIPALPEGGVLPFGPRGMTIAATGPQGVLVGGSNVGFRLTNATAPTKKLNWTVLERLTRLTQKGHGLHPEGLQRIDLAQLPTGKHRGLTFPIAAKPAVYSLEVTIQNGRGRRLGRYGEYIRVVERSVDIGIALAAYDNVVPGGYLESCFENHGTASVTPTGATLERWNGSSWHSVAEKPTYTPAQSLAVRALGPGESEKVPVAIPQRALPGLYKVTETGVTELGEPVSYSAEFGVL